MQLPHTSVTAPACKASCRRGAACCGAVPRLVAPPAPLTASVAAWSTVRRHGCSARRPSAPPGAGRSCGSLVPQAVAAPAQHFRRQQQQQLGGGRGSSCRDGCYCCATAARAASGAGCSTSSGSGSGSSSGSSSFGLSRVRHGRLQHGSGPRRRSQEPRRAAHTAAGGGKGPNDSGPADAHRDPDLDPGELDELMYELYCSSGGSSSGLDDVSCSQLPHYCGPLELREVPGAGVGVYVREDVAAGTLLLLATHPLALLRSGPGGGQPSSLDLAAALSRGALPPLAATWLTCLADGGGGGAGGGGGGRRRLLQLRSLFQQPFNAAAAAMPPQPPGAAAAGGSSSSGAAAAAAAAAAVACPLPPDAVVAVVAYNAYGEQRPDPVLTRMRAAAQQGGLGEREGEGAVGQGAEAAAVEAEAAVGGCVGLWPAFSLINHSCAPVASYGLVGDVMVVRAAADLSAGQQVTISYSGRRTLAPLAARRAYLLQHYGFLCACERCRLEAGGGAGAEEADGGGAGTAQEQQQEQAGGSSGVRRLLLPPELPDYLEGLHTTCGRMVGPHLAALLSGRRWRDLPATAATATAANAAAAATAAAADGTGAQQPWAGAGAGAGAGRNELLGESVGDIVMELQQLSGYLSQCWQQVLRAAASAGAGGAAAAAAAQEGVAGTDAGADAAGASGGEGEGEGEGQGEGLTEREVLWLEGGVFVLLDQLMTVAAAAGLLQRIAAEPLLQLQPAAAAEAVAAAVAVAVEAPAAASAVTGDAVAGEAAAGPAKGRRRRKGAEAGAGGAAAPAPPLSAPLAVQALAARRWRVEELPPPYLQTYVDLLAQASDVAGAVAPGSDLTTALAVRLLAAVAAAAGAESEAYREAELRCYDTLSTKYGVLDYDTYEQLLAACCHRYGAQYVRLPGLDPDSVAAPGAAARAAAGAEGEGGGSGGGSRQQRGGVAAGDVAAGGDGEGSGGGLAGLPVQAVEVEAEVVLD